MAKSRRPVLLGSAAFALIACLSTARAASDHLTADGSEVANADLLRGAYDATISEETGRTAEPIAPFFTTDWSVGLRGSYVKNAAGERIDTIVAPAFSMSHEGKRSTLLFEGDAELVKPSNNQWRIAALRLSAAAGYALDRSTTLAAEGSIGITQAGSSDIGIDPGVAVARQAITGEVGGEIVRRSGHFILTARGEAGRTINSPTILSDATAQDNTADNVTTLGGSFRLGFELSPRLILFTEAGRSYQFFDIASPSLGYKLDGTTDTLRGGMTAEWGRFITAEASVGVGLRRYTAAGLPEVTSTLYAARLAYEPDETFALSAAFDTTLAPPTADSAGTARIEYTASADARYTVNNWLALRASAGWRNKQIVGTADTEEAYGFGLGADYEVNAHTTLTADYAFERATITPEPTEDVHRITLGLVFSN